MPQSRIIRQQALQLLCQFDAGNLDVAYTTDATFDEEYSDTSKPHAKAASLAKKVWEAREIADEVIATLTPEWPMHRQPLVDRNILRLAHYEMNGEATPPIVAISEAVELANEFGTQRSPAFINGVLQEVMEKCQSERVRDKGAGGSNS